MIDHDQLLRLATAMQESFPGSYLLDALVLPTLLLSADDLFTLKLSRYPE
jgi:hypothetical protein